MFSCSFVFFTLARPGEVRFGDFIRLWCYSNYADKVMLVVGEGGGGRRHNVSGRGGGEDLDARRCSDVLKHGVFVGILSCRRVFLKDGWVHTSGVSPGERSGVLAYPMTPTTHPSKP